MYGYLSPAGHAGYHDADNSSEETSASEAALEGVKMHDVSWGSSLRQLCLHAVGCSAFCAAESRKYLSLESMRM